ncbi:GNAT family N-acetyltransferase [Mesorhizobium sp. CU2]|uniref:GNAT family N-acetyltransferase n=1 Tax=unclassified Mesorhizobium TaxID=325217 RepID=UPI0011286DAA|nr:MULTISPECIES: GNAT family N-acetyltransferase [unclassified Mesorhizobium]TPN81599.1 GNAT family N-acetyltransferase [Mesorhizobium sp. CU3]TPO18072.1 GNAT family N-acetyltransferase [Mesorhizobium sp. CU2]
MQQDLETPRLRLRPVSPADRDDLFALEQDPQVMRFLNGGRPTPLDGTDPSVDFLMPRGTEQDVWSAREKVSGAFVGWFALYDRGDGSAELGYRLRRAVWGLGYASEGARALVEAGFSCFGFARIIANTMAINEASRRVLEKTGFTHVRTFHVEGLDRLPGAEHGDVEYEIRRKA